MVLLTSEFYSSLYLHFIGFSADTMKSTPIIVSISGNSGGCFTNVSRALQSNLVKMCNAIIMIIYIYGENFKLKLCTCDQSIALGTCTDFQLESLTRSTISATHKFRENIFESLWNINETTPRSQCILFHQRKMCKKLNNFDKKQNFVDIFFNCVIWNIRLL